MTTYEDVAVSLGRPITDANQQAQIDWWITGTEMLIQARLGDLAELDSEILNYVVVEAVAAKVNRAGRSESSVTVSVDDGSVTRRYENTMSAGDILDEWWTLLSPGISAGAYSSRPGFEPDETAYALDSWT